MISPTLGQMDFHTVQADRVLTRSEMNIGEDAAVGEIRSGTPRSCSATKFTNSVFVGMLRTNGLSTDTEDSRMRKGHVEHRPRVFCDFRPLLCSDPANSASAIVRAEID